MYIFKLTGGKSLAQARFGLSQLKTTSLYKLLPLFHEDNDIFNVKVWTNKFYIKFHPSHHQDLLKHSSHFFFLNIIIKCFKCNISVPYYLFVSYFRKYKQVIKVFFIILTSTYHAQCNYIAFCQIPTSGSTCDLEASEIYISKSTHSGRTPKIKFLIRLCCILR